MRVLVTGGAGFLGTVLTDRLLAEGHEVRLLDSLEYGAAPLLSVCGKDGVEFQRGDVCEPTVAKRALEGADAVVHLAAIVGDPACKRRPDRAREVNLNAAIQLYRLSRTPRPRPFVFASTCSNYGKMADPDALVTEDSELRPLSLYAQTKVDVERALLSDPKNHVTVLRFATLYGLSPRMRFDLSVNEFTLELATKRRLTVFGEQYWRPYLHVRDAARAVAVALRTGPTGEETPVYNVGDSRENYQKGQIIELVKGHLREPVEIHSVHQPDDPRNYRVSFDKIHRALGFRIERRVPDGVREVAEAVRAGLFPDSDDQRYRN